MHLIGYGNPGRGDDGLGPSFAARIAARDQPGIVVSVDYQLTVDHALMIADAKRVVFVDAMIGAELPFRFDIVAPATNDGMSSHNLSPASVVALADTLYSATPEAYVLGIAGVEFGSVKEGLSPEAEDNLRCAEAFFLEWLQRPERSFDMPGGCTENECST